VGERRNPEGTEGRDGRGRGAAGPAVHAGRRRRAAAQCGTVRRGRRTGPAGRGRTRGHPRPLGHRRPGRAGRRVRPSRDRRTDPRGPGVRTAAGRPVAPRGDGVGVSGGHRLFPAGAPGAAGPARSRPGGAAALRAGRGAAGVAEVPAVGTVLTELGKQLAGRWAALLLLPGAWYVCVVTGGVVLGHAHALAPSGAADLRGLAPALGRAAAPACVGRGGGAPAGGRCGTVLIAGAAFTAVAAVAGLAASAVAQGVERVWWSSGEEPVLRRLAARRAR